MSIPQLPENTDVPRPGLVVPPGLVHFAEDLAPGYVEALTRSLNGLSSTTDGKTAPQNHPESLPPLGVAFAIEPSGVAAREASAIVPLPVIEGFALPENLIEGLKFAKTQVPAESAPAGYQRPQGDGEVDQVLAFDKLVFEVIEVSEEKPTPVDAFQPADGRAPRTPSPSIVEFRPTDIWPDLVTPAGNDSIPEPTSPAKLPNVTITGEDVPVQPPVTLRVLFESYDSGTLTESAPDPPSAEVLVTENLAPPMTLFAVEAPAAVDAIAEPDTTRTGERRLDGNRTASALPLEDSRTIEQRFTLRASAPQTDVGQPVESPTNQTSGEEVEQTTDDPTVLRDPGIRIEDEIPPNSAPAQTEESRLISSKAPDSGTTAFVPIEQSVANSQTENADLPTSEIPPTVEPPNGSQTTPDELHVDRDYLTGRSDSVPTTTQGTPIPAATARQDTIDFDQRSSLPKDAPVHSEKNKQPEAIRSVPPDAADVDASTRQPNRASSETPTVPQTTAGASVESPPNGTQARPTRLKSVDHVDSSRPIESATGKTNAELDPVTQVPSHEPAQFDPTPIPRPTELRTTTQPKNDQTPQNTRQSGSPQIERQQTTFDGGAVSEATVSNPSPGRVVDGRLPTGDTATDPNPLQQTPPNRPGSPTTPTASRPVSEVPAASTVETLPVVEQLAVERPTTVRSEPVAEESRPTTIPIATESRTEAGTTRTTTPATANSQSTATTADAESVELVQRVSNALRLAQQQGTTLRARLHPPELGTLQVEVFSNDGALTARLEVTSAAARQALVEHLPQLQEALAQHGTTVERIEVHIQQPAREETQHRQDEQRSQHGKREQSGRQQREQSGSDEDQRQESDRQQDFGQDLDELDIAL